MVTAFPSLEGLAFERLFLSGLKIVSGLKNLLRLILYHDHIGDADVCAVSSITKLQHLEFQGRGNVTDAGLSHLTALKSLRHLTVCNSYSFSMTDAGF
jgi:hypothetical protein